MTKNAPIGAVTDSPEALAREIKRRTHSSDGGLLAWSEHGDVFAQGLGTRAANRINREKPELIIGLYTKKAQIENIRGDVEVMQAEVTA